MKFFITTPIYYVNDRPHVGHAYVTLAADILARYHRLIGDDVFFLTGTDEHGAKIAEAAAKAGKKPQVFADEVSQQFKDAWKTLDISYDRFIRTTEPDHLKTVEDFLRRLHDSKFVYKGEYRGLYCRGCEEFKKPSDLVNGKCPIHLTAAEQLSEPAYFFKLSAFQTELITLISSDELRVLPLIRKHEVLGFLEGQPLEDIAISRANVAWGVPLPWDNDHTVYVWVDALINYYTARGTYWPPTWHLLGKDIIRFHCVIWPALLLAIGEPLPKNFFVHGFFTINGQKISKSLGNAIDPSEIIKKYGREALRYYLFRAFPFGGDGDFSPSLLGEAYTGGLANELGNLVQRVLVMTEKYRGGVVPHVGARSSNVETAIVADVWSHYGEALQSVKLDEAFRAVWDLVRFANQRIDEVRPWDLAKTDQEALDEALYELLEIIRHLSVLLTPLLPDTAQKICELLHIPFYAKLSAAQFEQAKQWGELKAGAAVSVGEVLFPRIDV